MTQSEHDLQMRHILATEHLARAIEVFNKNYAASLASAAVTPPTPPPNPTYPTIPENGGGS